MFLDAASLANSTEIRTRYTWAKQGLNLLRTRIRIYSIEHRKILSMGVSVRLTPKLMLCWTWFHNTPFLPFFVLSGDRNNVLQTYYRVIFVVGLT